MAMTRQYLIGELSSVLGELQEEVTDPMSAHHVARLRCQVERTPVMELTSAAIRGLELIDRLCRESLDRGDAATFNRLAGIGGELRSFGVCAGLFADTPRAAWHNDSSIRRQPEVRTWQ
jgi:hypothetical protein